MLFIHGKSPILHKIVFELRYRFGYTYLDRCGRTMNAIMRAAPEWMPQDQAGPQNTPLVSVANNCLFNFSSLKMDFTLEQPLASEIVEGDVDHFKRQVDLLTRIVIDQLELKEFSRVGLRAWYMFRSEDLGESESWLRELGLWQFPQSLETSFGGRIEAVGISIVIAGEDRKYRLAFNGVERSAQIDRGADILSVRASALSKEQDKIFKKSLLKKKGVRGMPEFASMIDIDASQDDPVSVDPRDFIETSLGQFLRRLNAAVPRPEARS